MAKILFPCDHFDRKSPEPSFADEYNAAKENGHDVFLFNDDTITEFAFESNIPIKTVHDSNSIILRSWMLSKRRYMYLENHLKNRYYMLLNMFEQYQYFHESIWALESINGVYTPEFRKFDLYPDIDRVKRELRDIKSKTFILKDYVKSVKDANNLTFDISIDMTNDQMAARLYEFLRLRDKEFVGGFVIKEKVDLKKYDGITNEWRMFVYHNHIVELALNTKINKDINVPKPPNLFVDTMLDQFRNKSNFYTVDFAELKDGSWVVLETGDGQVSGLPETTDVYQFYKNLK